MRAIMLNRCGGPEELRPVDLAAAEPGPGEAAIRQTAIGVNFVDVYHRRGLYPLPGLPAVIGVEGAGVVTALGPDVGCLAVGDRVAYAGPPVGGYATCRALPAWRLARLPDGIDDATGAAMMLRGLTAHMLFARVAPLPPGATIFLHAAAGGLGLMLAQWARARGLRVLGSVGSAGKARLAAEHGVEAPILHREADFVAAVRTLTDGRGVDLVVDGIGGGVLRRSIEIVAPFGTLASVGEAGGPMPAIDPAELGPGRSIALARPSVFRYAADPGRYAAAVAEVAAAVAGGLRVRIGARFPLAQAAAAHRALEAGATVGAIILDP